MHFYWSHLAIRIGGKEAFEAALRGEGKGFADTTFVRAGESFKQLADLKPFQTGFLGVTYPQSAGQFGDGKGAMMLMLNGLLGAMKSNSADKVGIPDDKLGWFPFPTVAGGKGDPGDTLGGLNGWLVTKGSPKEAADFLKFFSEAENQRQAAERGFYIPIVVIRPRTQTLPLVRTKLLRSFRFLLRSGGSRPAPTVTPLLLTFVSHHQRVARTRTGGQCFRADLHPPSARPARVGTRPTVIMKQVRQ